jgi:capsular polysaccharide biosynthesis protein
LDQNSGYRNDSMSKEVSNAFWKAVRNQKKLIIAVTLISGLIGFVLNFIIMQPVYESSANVLLTQVANQSSGYVQNNTLDSITSSIPRVPPLSLKTHMGLVVDETVMKRVIERLQLGEQGYTPKKLAGEIKVSSAGDNSNVIKVTVRSKDPSLSADLANSVCSEYGVMLTDINKKLFNSSIQMMLAETEALKAELGKAVTDIEKKNITYTLTYLSGKIYDTRIARDVDLGTTSVVLISPAVSSPAPEISGKILNTTLALLLGFAVSALLAFRMELRGSVNQVGSPANTGYSEQPEQN